VSIGTLDSTDAQVQKYHTHNDMKNCDFNRVHPLTGPFYIKGAEPGDLLEVEVVDIQPQPYGYTLQYPGFGYLREDFDEPFVLHWDIKGEYATCPDLPKIRIPAITHMGVMGVAPSQGLLRDITLRERELFDRGGNVRLPDPREAIPNDPAIASEGIRTISPHECGGNLDIKHLTKGARLLIPVFVEGALFSTGDAHYCQGDGEVCGTPIETGATLIARFGLRKGDARRRNIRDVQFFRNDYFAPPEFAAPRKLFATTGLSHNTSGLTQAEDLNIATRNALRNMVQYLAEEHGLTRQQVVLRIEVERHEVLLLGAAELSDLRMDLLGGRDPGRLLRGRLLDPAGELEERGQPAGSRVSQARIGHPLLDGERRHGADAVAADEPLGHLEDILLARPGSQDHGQQLDVREPARASLQHLFARSHTSWKIAHPQLRDAAISARRAARARRTHCRRSRRYRDRRTGSSHYRRRSALRQNSAGSGTRQRL